MSQRQYMYGAAIGEERQRTVKDGKTMKNVKFSIAEIVIFLRTKSLRSTWPVEIIKK